MTFTKKRSQSFSDGDISHMVHMVAITTHTEVIFLMGPF